MAVSAEKIQERSLRFPEPFFLAGSAQTLAEIAFRAAGRSGKDSRAASNFAGKPFPVSNFGQPRPSRVV